MVVKIPRFSFEKFPKAETTLTTQMKSVGEAMAIGRTFPGGALQKAMRSLENDRSGLDPLLSVVPSAEDPSYLDESQRALLSQKVRIPSPDRLWYLADALRAGMSVEELHQLTSIDPWFLRELVQIVELEGSVASRELSLADAKRAGFSDRRIATLTGKSEGAIRKQRQNEKLAPVYKRVDTCAAEFVAHTPYLYSSYEEEDEAAPTDRRKVLILGSGPNRIGQGLEFDTCCVQASLALRRAGFETVMVNCNPETVSTDYDTSDRLYFRPLTLEDVLAIHDLEKPIGAIVQMGGQTPLKLAHALENAGVRILGTPPDAIDRAEDRERRCRSESAGWDCGKPSTVWPTVWTRPARWPTELGLPVMVRPSYVLGGRAMEVCRDEQALELYLAEAFRASAGRPVLIDRFLSDATEIDVDAISDGREVYVAGGVMGTHRRGRDPLRGPPPAPFPPLGSPTPSWPRSKSRPKRAGARTRRGGANERPVRPAGR